MIQLVRHYSGYSGLAVINYLIKREHVSGHLSAIIERHSHLVVDLSQQLVSPIAEAKHQGHSESLRGFAKDEKKRR